jgi:diguanylate cyclase (GGDEF)-like protein
MTDSTSNSFADPFSPAHLQRLRTTYARVLPLVGIWAASFLYTDWHRDPFRAAASSSITITLFLAWAALRWKPLRALLILRITLWVTFVGFCGCVFISAFERARAGAPEPFQMGGAPYGLAVLIIAVHTIHTPRGARAAGFYIWTSSSLAALTGPALSWHYGTIMPGVAADAFRFVLAGAIALGLMEIFCLLINLQIRSAAQNALLQQYALTDSLTKLPNRRGFQTACEREFGAVYGENRPMSLIVLDVDRFKHVNDSHGHDCGDRVLQQLAQLVRSVIRPSDYPVRWGGDEFAILLPDSNLHQARLVAERIRLTIESFPFDVGNVTVSLGTAQLSQDNSVTSLFRRADQALYQAKRLGRNRIEADKASKASDGEAGAGTESVERLRVTLHPTEELPAEVEAAEAVPPTTT